MNHVTTQGFDMYVSTDNPNTADIMLVRHNPGHIPQTFVIPEHILTAMMAMVIQDHVDRIYSQVRVAAMLENKQ